MKKSIFFLVLVLLASGCGKKSEIKSQVEARKLCDGEHCTFPVVIPLSDKSISSFTSPISEINPFFRGFVGSIMNLGASMGAGKTRLTLTQPIPEIPEGDLVSIKVKRIFFFIEPNAQNENFNFLRRLAVKVSSANIERDNPSWAPAVESDSMSNDDLSFFGSLFESKRERHADDWDKKTPGLLLIKYNEKNQKESFKANDIGIMQIIPTNKPNATRMYLVENYSEFFTRIHMLSKSIIVELKNDPVIQETFKTKLNADSLKLAELEIGDINPCRDNVCMDLKVPAENLLPILKKGNAIKVDAYIDPQHTPKSFQLKGFLEFEIKIKTKI